MLWPNQPVTVANGAFRKRGDQEPIGIAAGDNGDFETCQECIHPAFQQPGLLCRLLDIWMFSSLATTPPVSGVD